MGKHLVSSDGDLSSEVAIHKYMVVIFFFGNLDRPPTPSVVHITFAFSKLDTAIAVEVMVLSKLAVWLA